jgi:NADPH:quinone reductase-like Zn-dependent oxidoreductase
MRAHEIRDAFGLDHLVATERPDPTPGPYQVRIRVKARSLNYRDLLMVKGLYNPRQKLPLIPCSDGAGVVDAIGPDTSRFKIGDRVMGAFSQGWLAGEPTRAKLATTLGGPLDGALADTMLLHEDGVVATPAHLTDVEASTLPCAALTAWSALVTFGRLEAGETVLVQGTGGVSMFALQFAKLLGARVIVTSSSDEKLARAKVLGADAGINYVSNPDWDKAARTLTDGLGPHQIVEVGGAGTLEKTLKAIRFGGTISAIGVLTGSATSVNLIPILMQNVKLQGILVGHREGFEHMNRAITQAQLKPVVDRVFPFEQSRQAFEHLASGSHFGKIVVAG